MQRTGAEWHPGVTLGKSLVSQSLSFLIGNLRRIILLTFVVRLT